MKKIITLCVALTAVISMSAKTIYLNVGSSTWLEADAVTFIHAWGGTETKTNLLMTLVDGESKVLSADIADNTSLLFIRMQPGSEAIDWDHNWGKTGDLEIPEDKDQFIITSFMDATANGIWSKYGELTLPEVKLAGTMTEWGTHAIDLVPAEDKLSASITVNLEVATYEFKIVSDGNYLSLNGEGETLFNIHRLWNHADHVNLINNGRNFELAADAAGEYTFTWTYADSTLVVSFPELPTLAIVGNFEGDKTWAPQTGYIMVPSEDKKSASVSINLEANTYEMKVWLNETYLSLNGEGETLYRIHRDYNHADNVNLVNVGRNFEFEADANGDYTFTWTYLSKNLVVTFPSKSPTAIENAQTADKAVKRMVNGQLIIVRDGVQYNVLGGVVR